MILLAGTQNYNLLFRHQVERNVKYWQRYVAGANSDTQALDRERERILKALTYGLDVEAAWPQVYELVKALAPYMERRGYWDTWNRILNQALQVARQRQDQICELDLSALLARLLHRQSRLKESATIYRRVIHLARRLGRPFDEARACTNLGYYYIEQGHRYRGEVLCCHALAIFNKINNDHGRAHTENHLGVLYTRQKMWFEAQNHLERACTIWEAAGDEHGLMRGYSNLGFLFNEMKQPDEAISCLEKALDQARRVGEEIIIGTIYTNLGTACRLKENLDKAEVHYRQAEAIFRRHSSLVDFADVYIQLGMMYLVQQWWSEAEVHLKEALEIWRKLGNIDNEIQTMICIAEYEKARGNQVEADVWLKKVEDMLERHGVNRQYRHLHQHVKEIRRSLTKAAN